MLQTFELKTFLSASVDSTGAGRGVAGCGKMDGAEKWVNVAFEIA
jgi:hypothetical protein